MDERFWSQFSLRLQHLSQANYKTFTDRLRRFLQLLYSDLQVKGLADELERGVDLNKWLAASEATSGSMVGSAEFEWPEDEFDRLGMQIALAKRWASDPDSAHDFATTFFGSEGMDEGVIELKQQILVPFAQELEAFLRSSLAVDGAREAIVPASDRIVTLDHNVVVKQSALDAVAKVSEAVAGTNVFPDADDRMQQLAELSAGQELLKASRARLSAIKSVLIHCLKYLAEKFADNAVGILAQAALVAILALLGIHLL